MVIIDTQKVINQYLDYIELVKNNYNKSNWQYEELMIGLYQDIKYLEHKDEIKFKHITKSQKSKNNEFQINKKVIESMCRYYIEFKNKFDMNNQYYELFLDFENSLNKTFNTLTDKEKNLLLCYFKNYKTYEIPKEVKMSNRDIYILKNKIFEKIINGMGKY